MVKQQVPHFCGALTFYLSNDKGAVSPVANAFGPGPGSDIEKYIFAAIGVVITVEFCGAKTRKRMSQIDRAAQFSPFAALTGYDSAILETARLTDKRVELDEGIKAILNEKLTIISDFIKEQPEVTITYFELDEKKDGGTYVDYTGTVKRIDEYERAVIMTDKTAIPIEQIYDIQCELFRNYEI